MDGQEVKLLGLFYLSSFLSTALNATEAIWVVFLMAKSFTFTQIGLNFAIFAFGRFIFEVPTGAFADAYGRKFSVILGWILEGAAFITFPFLHSFSTWLVVVFVSSIGYTMISGAQDAWAIDYLKKKNASVLSKNYFAHTEAIRNIAFAVAGLIGAALLTYFSMVSIFYAFTLGCILTAIILSFQKEYFAPKKLQIVELMKNSVRKSKQGINVSWNNKNLRYLTLGTLFLGLSAMSWVAWEPLFLKNSIEIKYFPLILSAAFLFSSFAAYVSKKIVLYFTDERKYLVVTMFLMSLSHVLVFVLFGPIAAITFFILKNGFFSFQNPIKQDMLHRLIPSRIRATIGSVDSMYDALAVVIATVGGGLLLDTVGVYYTLLITGLIMLPAVYFSSLLVIRQQTEIL